MTTETKLITGIAIGISILILVFGVLTIGAKQAPELKPDTNARIEIVGTGMHDWGEININGGNVEKSFQITNTGDANLEVTNVQTSCMCTEAQVIINGEESPAFGMHSQSNWKGSIAPMETAEIKVVFDPLFHGPQGTGPIVRFISFNTNDADNPRVEFQLTGNVIN